MKTCRTIQSSLVPYLDGELDPRDERRVEEHVRSCSNCQTELGQLRQVTLVLRDSLLSSRTGGEDEVREALSRAKRRVDELRHPVALSAGIWERLRKTLQPAPAALLLFLLAAAETLNFLELAEEALLYLSTHLLRSLSFLG